MWTFWKLTPPKKNMSFSLHFCPLFFSLQVFEIWRFLGGCPTKFNQFFIFDWKADFLTPKRLRIRPDVHNMKAGMLHCLRNIPRIILPNRHIPCNKLSWHRYFRKQPYVTPSISDITVYHTHFLITFPYFSENWKSLPQNHKTQAAFGLNSFSSSVALFWPTLRW